MSPTPKRKTWREKLHIDKAPKIEKLPPEGWKRMGGKTMLIARPLDVDALMKTIPKGKLATSAQIRAKLAKDHGAECACPTSTGIFIRIAAEAAEEDRVEGKARITPYWRVIQKDGSLHPKFPGGAEAQVKALKAEGHTVDNSSAKRPPRVVDFEKRLVKW
jgi:hypothetical protein